MKWDRLFVFAVAAAFLTWMNLAPNTFPQAEYGRGFPLKWSYDPIYKVSNTDEVPPYARKHAPPELWKFDRTALAVDVGVALLALGVVMAVNELVQTSAGNRPPSIPPNAWPRGPISSV
jgi:hypothetical protein